MCSAYGRMSPFMLFLPIPAGVAEWQTRRTQNPLPARACGFDSLLRHQQTKRLSELPLAESFRAVTLPVYFPAPASRARHTRRSWSCMYPASRTETSNGSPGKLIEVVLPEFYPGQTGSKALVRKITGS